MKTIYNIIAICCIGLTVQAQDLIIKTNGEEIEAKVIEIGLDLIKFKRYSNLSGPDYVLKQEDVFMIKYENGDSEVFTICDEEGEPDECLEISSDELKELPENRYYLNNNHNYFSMAHGFGASYGGVGIRAQSRFGGIAGFGMHGGIGVFPFNGGQVQASFGLKFFPFKGLYINTQFGIFGNQTRYSYSVEKLIGPSILTGIDAIFGKHFGLNAALGISKDLNSGGEFFPAADIGFSYKF